MKGRSCLLPGRSFSDFEGRKDVGFPCPCFYAKLLLVHPADFIDSEIVSTRAKK